MAEKTEVPIEMVAEGEGVFRALDFVNQKIASIQTKVDNIGRSSEMSAKKFDKALGKTLAQLNQAMAQMATLEKSLLAGATDVRQVNTARSLAVATKNASTFAATLNNAQNAAGAVQARLNQIDKSMAQIALKGGLAPAKLLADRKKFEDLDKTLKALNTQFSKLSDKARQTGGDFSRSFAAIVEARNGLFRALGDGRRTNFGGELANITDLQAGLGREIANELALRKRAAAEANRINKQVESEAVASERRKVGEVKRGFTSIAAEQEAQRKREEKMGEAQVSMANRLQKAREKERDAQRLTLRDRIAAGKEVARLEAKQLSTIEQITQARQVSEGRITRAQTLLQTPGMSRDQVAQATASLQIERARIGALNAQERLLVGHARAKQMSLGAAKELARQEARQLATLTAINTARQTSQARLEAAVARLAVARGKEARDLERIVQIEKARTAELVKQERLKTPKPTAEPAAEPSMFRPGTLGGAFAGTARYGLAAAVIYNLANGLLQGAQFAIQFEDALANLQAIAGATDQQMKGVAQTILEVGSNSKSSVLELTEAATTLAQAGFTTSELEQSLGGVARLSAASGATIKESVDLVTSAIGSFGLQADETNRITDVLVAALNRSKLSVEQVGLAIQYVGSTARENNISFEELTAAAGALANAGIRSGSTIGTGLRQLLVDLKTPTDDLTKQLNLLGLTQADVDVKTKGLAQVMTNLRDAGFGAAQAYGALEVRAAASYLTLANNLPLMQQLLIAEQQQGVALQAQERAMNSLSAQWQRFTNILAERGEDGFTAITEGLKELMIDINDLIEVDKALEKQMQNRAQQRLNDIEKNKELAQSYFEMGDAISGSILTVRNLVEEFTFWNSSSSNGVMTAKDLETSIADLNEEISAQEQKIRSVDESIQNLLVKQDLYKNGRDGVLALQTEVASLTSRFEGLTGAIGGQAIEFDNVIAAMRRYREEAELTLQTKLVQQQANIGLQRSELRSGLMSSYADIKDWKGPKALKDLAAKAFNSSGAKRIGYISDLNKQVDRERAAGTITADADRYFRKFSADLSNFAYLATEERMIGTRLEDSRWKTSQVGKKYSTDLSRMNGELGRVSGLSSQEGDALAKKILDESTAEMSRIEKSLNNPRSRLSSVDRRNMETALAQYKSVQGQARSLLAPTKADEKAAKAAERDAARAQRTAERNARRFNRGELKVSQTALKTAELDLDDAVKNIRGTGNFSVLSDGFKAVEEALAEWKEKRLDVMADEIKTGQLTGAQADNLNREVNNQIEAKFRDVRRAYGDAILKMLDNQIAAADRAFQRYVTPFEAQLNIASARGSSLDREALRGRVPDFVRDEQQRSQNMAQENLDRATIVANEEKLLSYTDALFDLNRAIELVQKTGSKEAAEFLQGDNFQNLSGEITVLASVIKGTARETGKFSEEDLEKLRQALEEVEQKIIDTRNSNEALKASLQGEGLLPTSFTEGLRRAAANYATINGLNRSFEESLIGGLDTAISDVHGTWNQFMYDMLTKPNQVLANFQNFAMGIIRALQRMAAEALANQIFGTILKLVAGAVAPSVSNFDVALPGPSVTTPVAPLPGFFNGGIVGYSEGGEVNHGVPNRDSVLTALARGEYVVRKKAVDSVGVGFLDGINKNGAAALPSTQIAMPPPAHQETNVYVLKEDPPPQMGPNDVLAVVANDVLKDGQMKRLIKHVSQGG